MTLPRRCGILAHRGVILGGFALRFVPQQRLERRRFVAARPVHGVVDLLLFLLGSGFEVGALLYRLGAQVHLVRFFFLHRAPKIIDPAVVVHDHTAGGDFLIGRGGIAHRTLFPNTALSIELREPVLVGHALFL